MDYHFDREIDRSNTSSAKWDKYHGRDILPFWVADMDFATPTFIREAIAARLDHEIIGYTRTPPGLISAFQDWLSRNYGWVVPEEWIIWTPGVVTAFNRAARAVAQPGGAILIPTPVYYPFLTVPNNAGQSMLTAPLVRDGKRWVMDFEALQAAVDAYSAGKPTMLMLSNPQNPTGRAYAESELMTLADFCLKNDLTLCSDEIHSAIILDESVRHVPIASLYPEIGERTISLFAASKTYNTPGLPCGAAVIPNLALRRSFIHAHAGLISGIGPLSMAASEAAFADQSDYIPELMSYLRANHARLQEVAGARMTPVEATYLAWIDLSDSEIADHPGTYLEGFGLGLSDGAAFAGPGFVRFNFACPQSLLEQGLERLQTALNELP